MLDKLEESGLGCFVSLKCYNSFMYADDVILLSTTVTDLQRMFNLCSEIFSDLDLPINVDKCHSLRIGPRCDNICCTLQIQGQAVHRVTVLHF